MIQVGSTVEIRAAYEMDSGDRTGWDEISGCEAQVLELHGSESLVYVRCKGEFYVNNRRLKWRE